MTEKTFAVEVQSLLSTDHRRAEEQQYSGPAVLAGLSVARSGSWDPISARCESRAVLC